MLHWHNDIVDLTHPIHDGSLAYPGDPACVFTPHATLAEDGYEVTATTIGTHHGTHIDAPAHFLPHGPGVDRLDLHRLCGPAFVIDLSHIRSSDSVIDVVDLQPFSDHILPGTRILLRTGWDKQFGQATYFSHSPMLSVAACEWLAARAIWLLGLDLPTLHSSEVHATHIPLLKAGVAIIESLRLSALDAAHKTVFFCAAPLPFVGLDGSPVRAFALTPPTMAITSGDEQLAIAPATTAADMLAALTIRRRVFVEEQHVPLTIEMDAADNDALHVLARLDGKPIGTLRILRHGDTGTVGRFAVLAAYRGHGVGRALMTWVTDYAPLFGLKWLTLHAQKDAAGFYERAGFTVTGSEFTEAGIPHVPMKRRVL